jgi:glutathione S-transferase
VSEFIVHSVPGSPFGRAVLIALEEKRATYRLAAVAPGSLRSAEHLARHPFGRVPTIDHDGFRLFETQAILRYIDRVIEGTPLTPRDLRAAARMDQIMNVNDWYLFQGAGNVIGFQRVVAPKLLGHKPDEAAIEAAMPNAHRVFEALAHELGSLSYFVGEELSLADIMLAPQMDFFAVTPEWTALTRTRPNLIAWLDRMRARPSLDATTWERVNAMANS